MSEISASPFYRTATPLPPRSIYVVPPFEEANLPHAFNDVLIGSVTGLLLFVAFLMMLFVQF